jgi:hypothetical protein
MHQHVLQYCIGSLVCIIAPVHCTVPYTYLHSQSHYGRTLCPFCMYPHHFLIDLVFYTVFILDNSSFKAIQSTQLSLLIYNTQMTTVETIHWLMVAPVKHKGACAVPILSPIGTKTSPVLASKIIPFWRLPGLSGWERGCLCDLFHAS